MRSPCVPGVAFLQISARRSVRSSSSRNLTRRSRCSRFRWRTSASSSRRTSLFSNRSSASSSSLSASSDPPAESALATKLWTAVSRVAMKAARCAALSDASSGRWSRKTSSKSISRHRFRRRSEASGDSCSYWRLLPAGRSRTDSSTSFHALAARSAAARFAFAESTAARCLLSVSILNARTSWRNRSGASASLHTSGWSVRAFAR
mmetsp:Transcript_32369/g.68075  ORF Transcript_32369/g.68075 Transcript_32369/m.68075 type:complete len:206 (-) Transcript_32369:355-972(-)